MIHTKVNIQIQRNKYKDKKRGGKREKYKENSNK